ncbi:hypothetical protein AB1Y20_007471 [Prymnesium parvum]|uniref:Uncharacterized protein n=1 Tax=Prymnesium parvum TaxID=97485 RepID=A0AB34IXJ5_PRYPA
MAEAPARVILKMSVQLPDGRKGAIHVFPGSDPAELAKQFCNKHGLTDPKLIRVVERHIVENVNNLPHAKFRTAAPAAAAAAPSAAPPHEEAPRAAEAAERSSDAGLASALDESRRRCAELEEKGAELQARLALAEEREAVQRKEMEELHHANARIATLAFAQAGKSTEEAAAELRQLLQPPGTALKLLNERYMHALQLLGDRAASARRKLAVAECWQVWARAQLQRRAVASERAKALGLAPPPELGPRSTDVSLQCTLQDAALDRAGDAMAAELALAREKRAAAERQVEELRTKLQSTTDELSEVTQALIVAKIAQAELNSERLGLDHDIKQLEKQIVIESVEQFDAIPFYSTPRGSNRKLLQVSTTPPQLSSRATMS